MMTRLAGRATKCLLRRQAPSQRDGAHLLGIRMPWFQPAARAERRALPGVAIRQMDASGDW